MKTIEYGFIRINNRRVVGLRPAKHEQLSTMLAPALIGNGWNCGRPAFCTILGDATAGVAKDDAKSLQFFKRACDGGDVTGCTSVSMMYQKGAGVRKDAAQAAVFWKKSLALNKAQ